MTALPDAVFTNGEVHTLADPDETHEAVAVRDGRVVAVGRSDEVDFRAGVETEVVDLEGRVLLPGFVDAHTHVTTLGRYLVHADLSDADSADACVERLAELAADREWLLGYGYDESGWSAARYLTRDDLDRVSEERPVVAFREDLHTASLNSVALARLREDLPGADVRTEDGTPTGVVVEDAVGAVREATAPDREETAALVRAAQDRAVSLGVTGVHDMVRNSHAPRVYRDLAAAGDLRVRVRVNYWADHLDAVEEAGLRTNGGGRMVRTGAIKTLTDGSFGARTAKLRDPYEGGGEDGNGTDGAANDTGQWVVDPDRLRDIVKRATALGLQVAVHAIGDRAIEAALDAVEDAAAGDHRHRIEHAELMDDDLLARFAESGAVASVQPNFLKWAREGGLYDRRVGERRLSTNRYADLLDAGVPLAFGSDCMPLDPLFGVQQAVTAPDAGQRLPVTEALRAYTAGAAHAGFDEERLGTVEPGTCADFTVLERSPWTTPADGISDIGVAMTVVDGDVVYDDR